MNRKVLTVTLIVAVGAMVLAPRKVQAGDDEWATAGKILAGLTAFHVLARVTDDGVEQPRYVREYRREEVRRDCRPAPRRYHRPYRHYNRHHYRRPHGYTYYREYRYSDDHGYHEEYVETDRHLHRDHHEPRSRQYRQKRHCHVR